MIHPRDYAVTKGSRHKAQAALREYEKLGDKLKRDRKALLKAVLTVAAAIIQRPSP